MRDSIKSILMSRDEMSPEEADELIAQAREAFYEYIECGEMEYAEEICSEYFGLEPDYLDEFM